jgi:hypothetical protein
VTVADQLRTQFGSGVWSIFGAPSLQAAQAATPPVLQQAGAEILAQRVGLPVAGPFADQQLAPAPAPTTNYPLYIGLGLGAFALIGLFVHFRRRA